MGSFRPYIPFLLAIRHCLLHLPQVIVSNLLKSPRLPFIFGFLVFSLILVTLILSTSPFLLYLPLLDYTVQDFHCVLPYLLLTSISYPKTLVTSFLPI